MWLPAFAVRGQDLASMNEAALAFFGLRREEVVGKPMLELVLRLVTAEDEPLLRHISLARQQGSAPPPSFSFRFRGRRPGDLPRLVTTMSSPPLTDGTVVYLLFEDAIEWSARTLSSALTAAAERFVGARDEATVMALAADVLAERGLEVLTVWVDGEEFIQGPIRNMKPGLDAAELQQGGKFEGRRLPRRMMPHWNALFETGRAQFVPDTHLILDAIHPAPVAALLKGVLRRQSMDAPVFVEGKPYAIIAAQAAEMRPADTGALELFARQVGAAVENVRAHRRAAERLREVERLQEELVASERLAAIGEASAAVAHEVRNPLGTIFNASALLRREPLSGPALAALSMLDEEASRIDELVRNLLDLARPLQLRRVPTDVKALVDQAVAGAKARFAGRVEFRTQVELPPALELDGTLVRLAIDNLLRNAAQSSPATGTVTLHAALIPGELELSVSDQGPGVPEEHRSRIFQPFFTTRATGTGLGLALAQRAAGAHGGKVTVGDAPGGGASFRMRLPLEPG